MMRTPDKKLAFLYFENESVVPSLYNFNVNSKYTFQWYNPENGEWGKKILIEADNSGILQTPDFPEKGNRKFSDWAAKISAK